MHVIVSPYVNPLDNHLETMSLFVLTIIAVWESMPQVC
jgi:hypothetical protein